MNWDEYFIKMAELVAEKSKDKSTKVGAVIVGKHNAILSTGFNGFPRGVNDDVESRHERPAKYSYTEHGERNAIYNAARIGVSLMGSTMYQNWAPTSCVDCARAIIQAGILHSVGPPIPFGGKGDWKDSLGIGVEMLQEAGVNLWIYDNNPVSSIKLILFNDWIKENK